MISKSSLLPCIYTALLAVLFVPLVHAIDEMEINPEFLSPSGTEQIQHRSAPIISAQELQETEGRVCYSFGSTDRSLSSPERFRGNIITVDEIEYLTEIKIELDYTGDAQLSYYVLQSDQSDGYYSVLHREAVNVTMGGAASYSSGDMQVPLLPDVYYAIGVAWEDEQIAYFFAGEDTAPRDWEKGRVVGGVVDGAYPPVRHPVKLNQTNREYAMEICLGPSPCETLTISIGDPEDGELISNSVITMSGSVGFDPGSVPGALDLFFVLDRSGSLTSTDPQNYRSSGAINLIQSLPEGADVRVGMSSFHTNGTLHHSLTSDLEAVSASIADLPRSGTTNMGQALQLAIDDMLANGRPGVNRFIILFSDGLANSGPNPIDVSKTAATNGIPIHTLFLGSDPNGISLMKSIGDLTGGVSRHVSSPEDLPHLFQEVGRSSRIEKIVITSSASPSTLIEVSAEDIVANLWERELIPVRTAPGATTTLTATVWTNDRPPCTASSTVVVEGGTTTTENANSEK